MGIFDFLSSSVNQEKIEKLEQELENLKKELSQSFALIEEKENYIMNLQEEKMILQEEIQALTEKIQELSPEKIKQLILSHRLVYALNAHYLDLFLKNKKNLCRQQYDFAIAAYNKAIENCRQAIESYEEQHSLDEYKTLKKYINKNEFFSLPSDKRNQLALNRYNAAQKTEFEVGLTYERYIGYLYEMQNCEVRYHGAINKFRDQGIDLYAIQKKTKTVYVIQCKRWNKNTSVGDGTIRNLHGSMGIAQKKFPKKKIIGILYTTTSVTTEAKKTASLLNIQIYDNFPIKDYPMIKCNFSENGEKIYHLPFDQMYDKTFITLKKGDLYVSTAEEAESLGFRHAHKWKPENKEKSPRL